MSLIVDDDVGPCLRCDICEGLMKLIDVDPQDDDQIRQCRDMLPRIVWRSEHEHDEDQCVDCADSFGLDNGTGGTDPASKIRPLHSADTAGGES